MKDWPLQQKEETLFVNYLISQVTGRASGRLEDACMFDMPRDKYFIGNLRSSEGSPEAQDTALQRELLNKIAPVAFGADFLLAPNSPQFQVNVRITWACYYRIFPTYDEQNEWIQVETEKSQVENNSGQTESSSTDELEEGEDKNKVNEIEEEKIEAREERRHRRQQQDVFCFKFRKISCQAEALISLRRVDGLWQIDNQALAQACAVEMERARQVVINDPETIKVADDVDQSGRISGEALASADSFQVALENLKTPVIPEWAWNVDESRVISSPEGDVLSFMFANVSPMLNQSHNREGYLFDVRASFEFDQNIVNPFELELAPRGFRYDRYLWGRGFNCALVKGDDDRHYHTTHTPLYSQARYDTRTQPEARFDVLAQKPLPILQEILMEMKDYLTNWSDAERDYQTRYAAEWEQFRPEFQEDWRQYKGEIDRFTQGLALIETDPDIQMAFKLTNETFRRAGDHPTKPKKTSWRLFQIVFLVTQIPGIATLKTPTPEGLAEREMVDIIYFPTGGGKTEAYLGVLVFHCFFDRLRGKTAGVTTWLRFPLRLLTLQQTQRMADIMGQAELVRRAQSEKRLRGKVAGFAVGYFVGKSSSPNELTPPNQNQANPNWSKANDPQERDKWKRVITCPACRTFSVRIDFDEVAVRIIHRCTNPNCAFPEGKIPIYIIDNEIYRYLPSVIVGTIDKLAGLGNQRKFSMILGSVTGICKQHGYINRKCCQKECNDKTQWQKDGVPSGLSGPTLFVQDELHLLREGLGTFDSHYETFTQELLKEMQQERPLKIIASSATIEAFARQVEHLYGRQQTQARVFPGVGPSLEESFYAQTRPYPQRLFLGIIPHNKTIFNTILELLEYFHAEIQRLNQLTAANINPYQGQLQPGRADWQDFIDPYLTSLSYFMATRHLSSIRTDIESHVNANLESEDYQALNLAELTGSTSTGEVARTLEKVEQPYQPNNPNAVLATSMVSHGVDIDRFNAMIFYGMPRQNAEYIQASSRVGRTHVGLVFMCLHPVRERDQSHYNYFIKFHEFLGQLVEPVAINRWSKFSLEHTLPGLFMGILLQLLANNSGEKNPNRYYMVDPIKKKIRTGEITTSQFVPLLKEAYRVTSPNLPAEQFFHDEIERRISQFLDQISGAGSQNTYVSATLYPQPLRSLRDVDEAIDIELDDTGSRWASKQA